MILVVPGLCRQRRFCVSGVTSPSMQFAAFATFKRPVGQLSAANQHWKMTAMGHFSSVHRLSTSPDCSTHPHTCSHFLHLPHPLRPSTADLLGCVSFPCQPCRYLTSPFPLIGCIRPTTCANEHCTADCIVFVSCSSMKYETVKPIYFAVCWAKLSKQ